MTPRLRPEFSDRRVCRFCGAPAERLGVIKNGFDAGMATVGFVAEPAIVKNRGVATHWCRRVVTADDQRNECGALRAADTEVVPADKLPDYCFEEGITSGHGPRPDRLELSAGND